MRNLEVPQKSAAEADTVPTGQAAFARLEEGEERAACALLSLAFRDNPINRAVIDAKPNRRERVNAYGMTASLAATRRFSFRRVALGPSGGTSANTSQPIGALIALDPGGYPAAPPPVTLQLRCLWGQGLRVLRRWGQVYRLLDEHHPKDPHCYLSVIATHPDHQGRGVGRRLLATWLEDVDARGMPGYLETDRRELLGFYEAAGFLIDRKLEAFGTSIWCMTRPAKNTASSSSTR